MNSDEQQYQRFLDGDIKGFEELVLANKDHLIYFIHRYVLDIHMAEDLAQDVFVDIYLKKERYHFQYRFKTYLYTIARNKAVDYIRKQKNVLPMIDFDTLKQEQIEEGLLNEIIWKEEKEQLRKAIQMLKAEYQILILLVDLEGFSYKETAKILHKTIPQVKVSLYRARKALKEKFHEGQ